MRKPYQLPDFHLLPGVPGMTGEALAALSDEELEKTLRDNDLEENKPACCRWHHRQTAVNLVPLRTRPKPCGKIYITKHPVPKIGTGQTPA